MKTILLTIVSASGFLAGCASPYERHDARVDRRYDRWDRTGDRVETRQYNRYDRRADRYDRVNTRYGY